MDPLTLPFRRFLNLYWYALTSKADARGMEMVEDAIAAYEAQVAAAESRTAGPDAPPAWWTSDEDASAEAAGFQSALQRRR